MRLQDLGGARGAAAWHHKLARYGTRMFGRQDDSVPKVCKADEVMSGDPSLDEILSDPIVKLVMQRAQLTADDFTRLKRPLAQD